MQTLDDSFYSSEELLLTIMHEAWHLAFQFPICIQRTRISFMLRNQFSFRVCNWFKIYRILSPKVKAKNNPNTPAWNLTSFIWAFCSVTFWANKRILHFYLTDFHFCVTPVSKSNNKFPEINKNIHSSNIKQWKMFWYIEKRASTFFLLPFSLEVLTTHN